MTHSKDPAQDRQDLQPLRLIGPASACWIVSKGSSTPAAAIPIDLYPPTMRISDRLAHLAPTLEGFSLAIGTFLWPFFGFSLDIRQFQDKNRHGELLGSSDFDNHHGTRSSPFLSKPTTYVTDTN
jgi:hypothetical protein